MIKLGHSLPEFKLKALKATLSKHSVLDSFTEISHNSYPGQWLVLFFWPKDFTFICPTEMTAFSDLCEEFKKRNAQLLGASTDNEFVHFAWRQQHPHLKNLSFPMLSDLKRELSERLGILDEQEGVAQRATFIVDPQHKVRFIMVTDLSIGRNPHEVLRVLDALQTGGLCPVNWKQGEELIEIQ